MFFSDLGTQTETYLELVDKDYYVNDVGYKNRFFSMNMYLHDEIVTHVREYRTYWQVLSQLGGFLGLFIAFGRVIVSYFSSQTLTHSLIDQLYFDSADLLNPAKHENLSPASHLRKLYHLIFSHSHRISPPNWLLLCCKCLRHREYKA